jgi:RNA-directed DNA polymerase
MELLRRGAVHRFQISHNSQGDDVIFGSKGFEIPKDLVWQAYKEVRANRGAPGYDGVTLTEFDKRRDKNLYKIWNRLVSGAYLPPAVLEKKIPKLTGGERTLGIPTVADRIAQGAVKIFLEAQLDPLFHSDSYGYRPNKSAPSA